MNGTELSITDVAMAAVTEIAQDEPGMEYMLAEEDVTLLLFPESDSSSDLEAI
jgi:hypothetical protein